MYDGTQISVVTWRTVHEDTVADALHSRRVHQRYLFMSSHHHKSKAFQVVKVITTKFRELINFLEDPDCRRQRIFTRYLCFHIYISLVITKGER